LPSIEGEANGSDVRKHEVTLFATVIEQKVDGLGTAKVKERVIEPVVDGDIATKFPMTSRLCTALTSKTSAAAGAFADVFRPARANSLR
jgi:hypothetical protein